VATTTTIMAPMGVMAVAAAASVVAQRVAVFRRHLPAVREGRTHCPSLLQEV
jgi:hypothetical protein